MLSAFEIAILKKKLGESVEKELQVFIQSVFPNATEKEQLNIKRVWYASAFVFVTKLHITSTLVINSPHEEEPCANIMQNVMDEVIEFMTTGVKQFSDKNAEYAKYMNQKYKNN